jgi:hypothetical protein
MIMSLELVGIVDYNGQTHCLEHASTVSSYRDEIYSVDPERQCWCGKWIGKMTIVPHPRIWPNYIDHPEGNWS